MTKLKFWTALSVATMLCLGLAANNVQAGSTQYLVGGEVNELEDDDFEVLFDVDQNGQLTNGDLFLGVITIQAFNGPPGVFPSTYDPSASDPTITGVFLGQVVNVVTDLAGTGNDVNGIDNTMVYFGSVGVTGWSALTGLTLPDPVNADTMFIAFDDVNSGSLTTTGTLQGSIDSFVGANKVYEFGYADANSDGIGDAGEFWVAHGDTTTGTIGAGLASIKNIINLDVLGTFGGAPELLPHTFLGGDAALEVVANDSGVTFTAEQELQAEGSISESSAGVWPFKTDTNNYIKPVVPEPSSIVLMGLGMAGLGVAGYRRRRQARKVA